MKIKHFLSQSHFDYSECAYWNFVFDYWEWNASISNHGIDVDSVALDGADVLWSGKQLFALTHFKLMNEAVVQLTKSK